MKINIKYIQTRYVLPVVKYRLFPKQIAKKRKSTWQQLGGAGNFFYPR